LERGGKANPESFRGQKPGKPASERFDRFPFIGEGALFFDILRSGVVKGMECGSIGVLWERWKTDCGSVFEPRKGAKIPKWGRAQLHAFTRIYRILHNVPGGNVNGRKRSGNHHGATETQSQAELGTNAEKLEGTTKAQREDWMWAKAGGTRLGSGQMRAMDGRLTRFRPDQPAWVDVSS
jgi:hypothetical protein